MTLDATVGGSAADSYLTVEAANEIAEGDLSTDPEVVAWLDAPNVAMKEQALRRATYQVNASLGSGWVAYSPVDQAASGLVFPRSIDYTGTSPKVPFIPRSVRMATFEQAKYLLSNARILAAARRRKAHNLDSASEPNISWSLSEDAGSTELSPAAQFYINWLVQAKGGRGMRSVRMSSRMPGAAS